MDEQMQQQIIQLVQAAMQGNQEAKQQIEQIMQAAQQGDPQAQQIAQAIQGIVQQMQGVQSARRGAKLAYVRQLRGICPEGTEMRYYKVGGTICKKCVQKARAGKKVSKPKNAVEEFKCGRKVNKFDGGGKNKKVVGNGDTPARDIYRGGRYYTISDKNLNARDEVIEGTGGDLLIWPNTITIGTVGRDSVASEIPAHFRSGLFDSHAESYSKKENPVGFNRIRNRFRQAQSVVKKKK